MFVSQNFIFNSPTPFSREIYCFANHLQQIRQKLTAPMVAENIDCEKNYIKLQLLKLQSIQL